MKMLLCAFYVGTAFFLPDFALASGGISDFAGPLEKVVNTITGEVAQYISIISMALCGVTYVYNKENLEGGFKLLLSVVFGISFLAFATSIVTGLFSFTGAVI